MSVGIAGLAHANAGLGLVCVCIFGVGHGMTTPVANLLIAEINPTRKAAALNLLNSSWGVGAMGCPFLVAAAQKMGQVTPLLYGMTGALLLLAVWLLATPMERRTEQTAPRCHHSRGLGLAQPTGPDHRLCALCLRRV